MRLKRCFPALLLAALVIFTAPVVGRVRDLLFDVLSGSAVQVLALASTVVGALLFLYALWRIRERRGLRYAGLAMVGVLLWIQTVGFQRGLAEVDVVEKIHVFEYGLLAYLLYRGFRAQGDLSTLLLPILWVAFAGTLEEWMQWYVESRVGEVRDVLLNIFAGACGLLFSLCLEPPEAFTWRLGPERGRLVARTAAGVVLTLGLFFYCAHLGYVIEDPEIGRFRSWFTADELRELSVRRAAEWATNPPTRISLWGKEDYYLTEAAWHANHRNSSQAAGNAYFAWQANRILEKYYAPFLDLHSFRGSGQHRFAPEVRQALAAQVPRVDPQRYLSPVLAERIYPWPPKALFLAVLLPVVVLLWALPWLVRQVGVHVS